MTTIVQLSDLHLLGHTKRQGAILEALVEALARDRAWRGSSVDILVISGDVYDSASIAPDIAVEHFRGLLDRIQHALGGNVPTVVVPGNHDRRRLGLVGPHNNGLFDSLAQSVGSNIWIHGTEIPFLAEVVPSTFHHQPLWLVAYDSTFLPSGLVSAGGMIREADLLEAASSIGDQHPDWPVVLLVHHHLVPTPLTDLGTIEVPRIHPWLRWGLTRVLPRVVAHADREELTMTALGAGTALSTLHTLGRPVLVLHGHKHYAAARLLTATREGHGDVLVVAAGSAGTTQSWIHETGRGTARLWPSFNVIEFDGGALSIDAVYFGYKGRSRSKPTRTPLVRARRRGWRWDAYPVPEDFEAQRPYRLEQNHSECRIVSSRRFASERWDVECTRWVARASSIPLRRYVETVDAPDGARLLVRGEDGVSREEPLPANLAIGLDAPSRYRLEGGLFRTLAHATRTMADRVSPFASVALMNRYASRSTRLAVAGLGPRAYAAFGSAVDLGNGLERPLPLWRDEGSDRLVLDYPSCPPRTLLRIYWRLDAIGTRR